MLLDNNKSVALLLISNEFDERILFGLSKESLTTEEYDYLMKNMVKYNYKSKTFIYKLTIQTKVSFSSIDAYGIMLILIQTINDRMLADIQYNEYKSLCETHGMILKLHSDSKLKMQITNFNNSCMIELNTPTNEFVKESNDFNSTVLLCDYDNNKCTSYHSVKEVITNWEEQHNRYTKDMEQLRKIAFDNLDVDDPRYWNTTHNTISRDMLESVVGQILHENSYLIDELLDVYSKDYPQECIEYITRYNLSYHQVYWCFSSDNKSYTLYIKYPYFKYYIGVEIPFKSNENINN